VVVVVVVVVVMVMARRSRSEEAVMNREQCRQGEFLRSCIIIVDPMT
jgi:hypothetical protein